MKEQIAYPYYYTLQSPEGGQDSMAIYADQLFDCPMMQLSISQLGAFKDQLSPRIPKGLRTMKALSSKVSVPVRKVSQLPIIVVKNGISFTRSEFPSLVSGIFRKVEVSLLAVAYLCFGYRL